MLLRSDSAPRPCRATARVLLASLVSATLVAFAPVADSAVGASAVPASAVASPPPGTSLAGRWSWPVPSHEVVTGFEAPAEVWSAGHRGVDLAAAVGTVVLAPDAGVVHFAGVVVDRPVVSIEHAGGVLSSFEPVTPLVAAGATVERGQSVGVVVAGHCADRPCVHLGARVDGVYVSPLILLGVARRAILLPTRPLGRGSRGRRGRSRGGGRRPRVRLRPAGAPIGSSRGGVPSRRACRSV